ncbi:unnamed protein product [Paramecium sonneborni]|uniref:Uncharacterized protein n=1 Tax=Paramecium sonneborni TaxID=65129 RepID=A0A8S1LVE2_9CILI|nr:unnamed protein product [Paramecium sonneborni]
MQNRLAQFGQQSIIPIQATGKYGDQFFDLPQVKPFSLKLLKAKGRPNQNPFKKNIRDEINSKEIDMDKPFFEVFNHPNQNYLKIINSEELRPQIIYYYHSPNISQNEQVIVDKDNADLVERAIKNQHADIRKLEVIQQRILLKEKLQKEIKQEMQKKFKQKQEQEDDIKLPSQNLNFNYSSNFIAQKPQNYDQALQQSKSQITLQSQFKDIQESLYELQRIQEQNKQKEILKKQQEEESFKQKIESVQRYGYKNWKCSSQELRALIQKDKLKKHI